MPIINIHMLEGRTNTQKSTLVSKMTEVVCDSLQVSPEKVKIIITEMPKNCYAIGGKLIESSE